MGLKGVILGVLSGLLSASLAVAGEFGTSAAYALSFNPVITLFGGIASINANQSQTSLRVHEQVFVYHNQNNHKTTGFGGGFLGVEHLLGPNFFMQAGAEYSGFGGVTVNGVNTLDTAFTVSTPYHYRLQTQQALAVAKLFSTVHHLFHPYAAAGVGVAINRSSHFNTDLPKTDEANHVPTFSGSTRNSFSYSLGMGLNISVNAHVRLGVGYRFSDFGKTSLGKGTFIVNKITFPVPSTLNIPNVYANQWMAQISYLI